jgi:hypothetical protein
MQETAAAPAPNCLNCGAAFAAFAAFPASATKAPKFCPECGQDTHNEAPTLREFAQQFGGAYISTEGALWRTLKLLLTQPGELTRQYLAGRRKHYVLPLRLYLTISLVALLIVRWSGTTTAVHGLDNPALLAAARADRPSVMLTIYKARAGLRDGVFQCVLLPDVICARLKARVERDPVAFLQQVSAMNERLVANFGTVMFVLLPIFTFGLWLVYRNRRMRYTAHLVYALHMHAFWFIVLALMQIPWALLDYAGPAVMALYAMLSGRRVYGGRWGPRLLRFVVLSLIYASVLLVSVPVLLLAGLLV